MWGFGWWMVTVVGNYNKTVQHNCIHLHFFPLLFGFLSLCESCRLKTQPAEVDKTPRESNFLSLFFPHCEPLCSMSHLSSYHSATQNHIFEQFSTTHENVPTVFWTQVRTCAAYIIFYKTSFSISAAICSPSHDCHSTSHYSSCVLWCWLYSHAEQCDGI